MTPRNWLLFWLARSLYRMYGVQFRSGRQGSVHQLLRRGIFSRNRPPLAALVQLIEIGSADVV
jgi:hypothetical protein